MVEGREVIKLDCLRAELRIGKRQATSRLSERLDNDAGYRIGAENTFRFIFFLTQNGLSVSMNVSVM